MDAEVMPDTNVAGQPLRRTLREAAVRRCIATGVTRPKAELIRFVLGPDGSVTPDLAESLPGRGAWVTADRKMLERAARTNAFAKAFETTARVPSELIQTVEWLLVGRCIDRLRFARKAGALAVGAEAAERWLRAGRVAMLIVASDAGGRHKDRVLSAPALNVLTAGELGSVFGWSNVGQLAVAPGGFADALAIDLRRLEGLRDGTVQLM